MAATIRLDLPHAVALGQIMGQIRLWLDSEGVAAAELRWVVASPLV